jgi:hypothetical protein
MMFDAVERELASSMMMAFAGVASAGMGKKCVFPILKTPLCSHFPHRGMNLEAMNNAS